MEKKYFNGLDAIRAIAALLVVIHHLELTVFREFGGQENLGLLQNAAVHFMGKRGVHLFFILSGFLITLLLIQEKIKKGSISVGKFYLRRVLRIWPLYFLTVFIGFVLLPFLVHHFEFLNTLQFYPGLIAQLEHASASPIYYFIFFIPNLALQTYPAIAGASHLWSIGVEEQFYLFWPLIFLIKNVRIQLSIVIAIALMPFFPLVINRIPGGVVWSQWLSYFPFFWMAIGGLGAFVFHQFQERLEKPLVRFNLLGWLLSFGLLLWCMIFKVNDYFFGLMGLILILRSSIGYQWLPDKFPILPFIGRISFGIYIYHPLVMFLILSAFQFFSPNWHDVLYLKVMAYLLVIFASALLAWVSFRFFERPFIRLKDTRFGV